MPQADAEYMAARDAAIKAMDKVDEMAKRIQLFLDGWKKKQVMVTGASGLEYPGWVKSGVYQEVDASCWPTAEHLQEALTDFYWKIEKARETRNQLSADHLKELPPLPI